MLRGNHPSARSSPLHCIPTCSTHVFQAEILCKEYCRLSLSEDMKKKCDPTFRSKSSYGINSSFTWTFELDVIYLEKTSQRLVELQESWISCYYCKEIGFTYRQFGTKPHKYCISSLIKRNFYKCAETLMLQLFEVSRFLCSKGIKKKRKLLRKFVTGTLKLTDKFLSQQDNNAQVQVLKDNIASK